MSQSNLRQQFLQSILKNGKFGTKKHGYKIGTENDGCGYMPKTPWVFSDNYKDGLKAFAFQMAKFVNKNYPLIKLLSKIKAKHWNEFLKIKAVICSTKTLGLYCSYINKLEECVEEHFKLKYPLKWTDGLILPESIKTPSGELLRVQQMTLKDYNKILEYVLRGGTWSRAPVAISLTKRFGLRVQECSDICAKNVHLDEVGRWGHGFVEIWGKGNRYRKIDVLTNEDREYLKEVAAKLKPEDKIVGIDAYSINQALRRACKALGIKKKYPVTGIHSIRKLYSQLTYRFVQSEKGMTEKEAMQYVNAQLGYSEERDEDLLAIYVKDVKRKIEKRKSMSK